MTKRVKKFYYPAAKLSNPTNYHLINRILIKIEIDDSLEEKGFHKS